MDREFCALSREIRVISVGWAGDGPGEEMAQFVQVATDLAANTFGDIITGDPEGGVISADQMSQVQESQQQAVRPGVAEGRFGI